jgi:hypothetical protein
MQCWALLGVMGRQARVEARLDLAKLDEQERRCAHLLTLANPLFNYFFYFSPS